MRQLDLKDRRLLFEIDLNAREGTSLLGKKIRLSQEGTYYRLKRLEEKGVISGYMALLNFGKIGYTGYGVYARFQNVSREKKKQIITALALHDHIYWIAEFGGRFDVAFAILAKSIMDFNVYLTDISTTYADMLKDFTVAIRVELAQFPRKYLLKDTSFPRAPGFGKKIEYEEVDHLDRSLLAAIAQNARLSVLELALVVGKPASTVGNRLKLLEKKGIIQGYSAKIHCQEFGYQSYQLFINTHNLTREKRNMLFAYCRIHPHIIFFVETVGKWNFEIVYEIQDQKELQDLIIDIRTRFSDIIADVESAILFDHYVKYNQYPFLLK